MVDDASGRGFSSQRSLSQQFCLEDFTGQLFGKRADRASKQRGEWQSKAEMQCLQMKGDAESFEMDGPRRTGAGWGGDHYSTCMIGVINRFRCQAALALGPVFCKNEGAVVPRYRQYRIILVS